MPIRKVISRSILDGTVAPIDTTGTASSISLTALSASIAATATDVFVYDTRKDSDGGAWRKRTSHTSWYNETLNTATRGSRREFPAAAVIVATTATITIYDGDSPDLPMWIVFQVGTGKYVNNSSGAGALNSVAALNGQMTWTGFRLGRIDFIKDSGEMLEEGYYNWYTTPISTRNSTPGSNYNTSGPRIVNNYTNNVAMTVLPNAPIDVSTGLPIPTIAVTTEGGVSVVHNNGTVANLTNGSGATYNYAYDVAFLKDNKRMRVSLDSTSRRFYRTFNIPYANRTIDQWDPTTDDGVTVYTVYDNGDIATPKSASITASSENSVGTNAGLCIFDEYTPQPTSSLHAYISTKYNTGWMVGNGVKGTWLSDSTVETVAGSNLISNGTFDANVTGWTAGGTGASISWNAAGRINVVPGTGEWGGAYAPVSVVLGKTYVITGDIISVGGGWAGISGSYTGGTSPVKVFNGANPSVASYTFYHTATQTGTLYIAIDHSNTTANNTIVADNISVRIADPDRSTKSTHISHYGSITKTAVNTGNDLVGYSGFGTNNYLQQPYNSALDFGTGNMCVSGWIYNITGSGANRGVVHRNDATSSGGGFILEMRSDDTLLFQTQAGSANVSNLFSTIALGTGWNHFVATVTGGGTVLQLYINGSLNATATGQTARSQTNTAAFLRIGQEVTLDRPFNGSLALIRVSATVPVADQVYKMYNNEKNLFAVGAKACLYGSNDPVYAIAYDDATDLLHVGTASGRSVFDGLRRVENTTTGVSASISASNGLVAEQ